MERVLREVIMRVSDLISILKKADPNADVQICYNYDSITIDEVITNDGEGNVLLGNNIPPEKHGLDYKYEDE
jgi:hypothetical protein